MCFNPIMSCQQPEVIAIVAGAPTRIIKIFCEQYVNSDEGKETSRIVYGEKFRFCIDYNRIPEKHDIIKKIDLDYSVSFENAKQTLRVEKDKNFPLRFNTEWITIPLSAYTGADQLEKNEKYDYETHQTTNSENLVVTIITTDKFDLKEGCEKLTVSTYCRNYEEWVGINKKDGVFYEDYFIGLGSNVNSAVKNFSDKLDQIDHTSNDAFSSLKEQVEKSAKALWQAALDDVKGGNLDDRPLYWGRNKMQVCLKRHPLFKDDYDPYKSIIIKESQLASLITLFEEKSRNYTGLNFSKAGGKKKVLITGFDPFILNQFSHPLFKGNIKQSNPSGAIVLSLMNDNKLGAYIETMVIPVRYADFDGSLENDKGQGEGIIEKYIKSLIDQVDMIVTVSQYLPSENVIDMFATSRRGGFNDNMDFTREANTQALTASHEWIQTTLPKEFETIPGIKFNWKFNDIWHKPDTFPKDNEQLTEGSGGNYLSNEIFYCVAKLRKEYRPELSTGHFHVEMLQQDEEDINKQKTEKLINLVKKGLIEAIKAI